MKDLLTKLFTLIVITACVAGGEQEQKEKNKNKYRSTTVSLRNSIVEVSSNSVTSGENITLTLISRNSENQLITTGGYFVSFAYAGGESTGDISTAIDNNDGTYTAIFTGATAGSATTITARVNSFIVTSELPTVTVRPGVASEETSTLASSANTVVNGNSIDITLTARDASSNLVTTGGDTIVIGNSGGTSDGTFSAVTDNNDGTYSVTFTGTSVGSATIVGATLNGELVASALSVTVTAQPNSAPVLDNSGTMTLTNIPEDSSPSATSVRNIIDSSTANGSDAITDADAGASEGLAIIGLDNTNGDWQYNSGIGWNAIPTDVDLTKALLLDEDDLIRFVPDANYFGSAGNITFHAWDLTSGSSGDTNVDISTNGNTTAFSTDSETATLNVNSVNDAPTFVNNGITIDRGDTGINLGSAHLDADDVDDLDNSNIIYTVKSLPNNGITLKKSNVAMNVSDTFTEADLVAGNIISIDHDNTATTSSTFTFALADHEGAEATGAEHATPATFTIGITAVNQPPTFTSSTTISINENQTSILTVTATDPESDSITFTEVGGSDANLLSITAGGVLTFDSAPNYEAPADSDTNNTYVIQVQADDGYGNTPTQTITVTVDNVNEAPVFTSSVTPSAGENQTAIITVTVTDPEGDAITFSEIGGLDAGTMSITGGGVLTFDSAPNFESPGDNDTSNDYEVQVQADDGNGNTPSQSITVSVTNVNEAPVFTSSATPSANENQTAIITVTVTDPEGDTITFSEIGGVDAGTMSITAGGVLTFDSAPDFELPTDNDTSNDYVIEVQADDGNGNTPSQEITVSVNNANEAPTFTNNGITIDEGDSATNLSNTHLDGADVDDTNANIVYTVESLPTNGVTLKKSGGAVTAGVTTFTEADLVAGNVMSIEHDGSEVTSSTFTFSLSDDEPTAAAGATTGSPATFTITINSVNDVPTFTNNGITISEGASATNLSDTHLDGADVDDTNANIIYTVESLPTNGVTLKKSGGAVTAGVTTFTEADLVAGNVMTIEHDGSEVTSSTFTFSLADDEPAAAVGATSGSPATFTITINPVNEAPIFTNNGITISEGASATNLSDTHLDGADVDDTNDNIIYTVESLPTNGVTLKKSGSAVTAGVTTFTEADLVAGNVMSIEHDGSEVASSTFTFSLADDEPAAAVGATSGSPATFTITINPVNDAPTFTNNGITISEGASATNLSDTHLDGADVDDTNANIVYTVESLPTNGVTLKKSGGAVTAGVTTFTEADLVAGNVMTIEHDGSEVTSSTFTFSLADDEPAAAVGATSGSPATFTITINPVNEAPTFTNNGITISEGASATNLSDTHLDGADVDDTNDNIIYTVESLPTNGVTLKKSGSAVTAGVTTFTEADLVAGNVMSIEHDGSEVGSSTFTFSLADDEPAAAVGATSGSPATFTITINPVNDAPTFTNNGITISEGASATNLSDTHLDGADIDDTNDNIIYTVESLPTNGVTLKKSGGAVTAGVTTFTEADLVAGNVMSVEHDGSEVASSTFTFSLADDEPAAAVGATSGSPATFTITINPANDAPTFTNNGITIDEGDGATNLSDTHLDGADIDDTNDNIIYTVESLPTNGVTLKKSGGAVTAGVTTFTEADLVAGNVMTIEHDGSEVASSTFTFSLADDEPAAAVGATSGSPATFTITINPVNDAPTFTNNGITISEGASATNLSDTHLDGADVDDTNANIVYTVESLPTNGVTLKKSGSAVTAGVTTFTEADLVAGNVMSVEHDGSEVASSTFTFSLADDEPAAAVGATSGSPATFTITINPANDAPTFTNNGITIDEGDGATNLSDTHLDGADIDDTNDNIIYTVESLPTNGVTLKKSGGAVTAGVTTFTEADLVAGNVMTIEHDGSEVASSTFTFSLADDEPAAAVGATSGSPATFTITINATNDAPVLSGVATFTLATIDETETTNAGNTVAEIITSAGGNPITDADSGAVEGFALYAVNNTNGQWQYDDNDGSGWQDITGISPAAAILLDTTDKVRFVPSVEDDATSGSISFRAWDTTAGASGDINGDLSTTGGSTAFSDNVNSFNISITNVNDAPVLATNGGITISEGDTGTVFSNTHLEGTDVDDADSAITFTVESLPTNGVTLKINGTGASISDTFTEADIDGGLITIDQDGSSVTSSTFTFSLADDAPAEAVGATSGSPATFTITINPINDPPVLATNGGITIDEGDTGTVFSNTHLEGTDVDDADSATIFKVESLPTNGVTLKINGTGASADDTFTEADIDGGLITFDHDGSEAASSTFTFSLADDGGEEATGATVASPATFTITINPVNDAPVLTTNATQTIAEGATATAISNTYLVATDVDDTDANTIYTVRSLPTNGVTLKISGGAASVSDTFTEQNIDNGDVTIEHDGSEQTASSFTFSLADDGGEEATGATAASAATFNITISAVNDAPTFTNNGITIDEGDSATNLSTTHLDGADVDDTNANIIYTVESLPTNGVTLKKSGGVVTAGVTTFTEADLVAGNVMSIEHDGSEVTSSTFTFSLADDEPAEAVGATSASPATFTITINAVNDAPTFTNNGITIDEGDSATNLSTTHLDGADVDDTNDNIVYTVESLPTNGVTLKKSGGAVTAGVTTFTEADLVAGNVMSVEHDGSEVTSSTFTFSLSDDEPAEAAAATSGSPATFTITINPVNEAPTFTNNGITIDEGDSATNLSTTHLDGADVDDTNANIIYTVESLPTNGVTLKKSGGVVTAGVTTFTEADLVAGNVMSIEHDGSEVTSSTFTFSLADDEPAEAVGATSASPATFTITINAVNDAPTFTNNGITISEGASSTNLSDTHLDGADVDDTNDNIIYTVESLPTNGVTLKKSGGAVTAGVTTFTEADLVAGNVMSIEHDGSEVTSSTFTFSLADDEPAEAVGATNASPATFTITINAVNDAPTFTNNGITIDEGDSATNLSTTHLDGADIDDTNDNIVYTIESLPTNGVTLKKSGGAVTAGVTTFTEADLVAGNVMSVEHDGSEVTSSTFTFSLADDEPAEAVGATNASPATFTITINPVNDAPTFTNNGITISEGASATNLSDTHLDGADVDDTNDNIVYTVESLPTNGVTLKKSGGAVTAGVTTFTEADLVAGNVMTIEHDGSEVTSSTFTFSLADDEPAEAIGATNASPATFTITINTVNDAPTFTNNGITISEGASATNLSDTHLDGADVDDTNDNIIYTVESLPTNGVTLKKSGGAVTAGVTTFTEADLVVGNVMTIEHDGSEVTSSTFTFSLADDEPAEAVGATNASPATFTITINPVNDAPTFTNNGITISEGTSAINLSDTHLDGADVDDTNDNIIYTVESLPTNGVTLKKSGGAVTAGVTTFTEADLVAGNVMSVEHDGTEASSSTFTFSLADDAPLEAVGATSGSPATFTITINGVNDAPTFTNNGITIDEGDSATNLSNTHLDGADVDDTNDNIIYTIESLPTNGVTLKKSGSAVTAGVTTFTEADLVAGNVMSVEHDGSEVTSSTFTFSLADDEPAEAVSATSGSPATFTITINPVNDAPTFTNNGITIDEGDSATNLSTTHLDGADVDDTNDNIIYTIESLPTNGVTLKKSGGAVTAGATTFTEADLVAGNVMTIEHDGSEVTSSTFTFSLADDEPTAAVGATSGSPATFTITINPVNEAPTFTNNGITIDEGDSATNLSTTHLDGTDVDDTNDNIIYTIESLPTNGVTLKKSGGAVTAGVTTFTEADLVAGNIMTIEHDGSEVTSSTFTFSLADDEPAEAIGATNASPATFTITINAANDAPTFTNNGITIDEGDSATNLSTTHLDGADIDDTNDNIIYTVESLPTNGVTLKKSGGAVTAGVTTFTEADLVAGNVMSVEHDGSEAASSTFTFSLADDEPTEAVGATSGSPATFTITINPINDAPTFTNNGITIDEGDGATNLSDTHLDGADVDDTNDNIIYTVESLPTNGVTLKKSGGAVTAGVTTFTEADLVAGNIMTIEHDGSEVTSSTFTFSLADDEPADAVGATSGSPATFTITINAANDAPTFTNNGITINEGASATNLSNTHLDGADIDDADSAIIYTIKSLPTNGVTLKKSGGAVVVDVTTFTEADLIAGNVMSVEHDGSEQTSSTFTFALADDGGAEATGAEDATPATFTITITPQNDAPTFTNNGITISQGDTGTAISNSHLEGADVDDADSATTFTVESLPTNGVTLKINGSGASINDTFTEADIDAGNVTIDHDGVATTTSTFTFSLADDEPTEAVGATTGSPATFTITVNPVASIAVTLVEAYTTAGALATGTYGYGDVLEIRVTFDDNVYVTGTPQLTIDLTPSDKVINYLEGSGTSTLTFSYTVLSTESSTDLDYAATTSLALNSGTIKGINGSSADLTLPAPGASGSIANAQAVVIDGADALDPAAAGTYNIMFVTSTTYDGVLGGLAGADAKCNAHSTGLEEDGNYIAILSDLDTNAADRFTVGSLGVRDTQGTPQTIATSEVDLFDGAIDYKIRDESGGLSTNEVWTGTDSAGLKYSIDGHRKYCVNWTDNATNANKESQYGDSDVNASANWISAGVGNCDILRSLYCISPAIAGPPSNAAPVAYDVQGNGILNTQVSLTLIYEDYENDDAETCAVSALSSGTLDSCTCTAPGVCTALITPANDSTATITATYTVTDTDNSNTSASANITIEVGDDPYKPILISNEAITINEGSIDNDISSSYLQFRDEDDADTAITYTVASLPINGVTLKINNVSANISDTFTEAQLSTGSYVTLDHDGSEGVTSSSFTFWVADDESKEASTATSASPATFNIVITPQNDAPVLDNTGIMTLTDIDQNSVDPAGDTVADMITSAGGDRITDGDNGAVEGIAIISIDNTNGDWQYFITAGSWQNIPAVSATSALLLDADDMIRFIPDTTYLGNAGNIEFRAWDVSSESSGSVGINASINGGTTAFSTATETATLDVLDLESPPTISDISNQTTLYQTMKQVSFEINDLDTSLACNGTNLSFSSSDISIVANSSFSWGGTAPNCTVDITPENGVYGTTSITITVTDGTTPVNETFTFAVGSLGPISAAHTTISVDSSSITTGSSTTITVQAKDASDQLMVVGGDSIELWYNGGTSTGTISSVTDNNDGTYTATFTGVYAGTATTVNGSANSSDITTTLPTVTVTESIIASGLVMHVDASKADGTNPGSSTCPSSWENLADGTKNGTLTSYDSACSSGLSGWVGSGTAGDPYSLRLDGIDDHVDFNPNFSNAQFTIQAWVRYFSTPPESEGTTGADSLLPVIALGSDETETTNVDINYVMGYNRSGHFVFDYENASDSVNNPYTYTSAANKVEWYHITITSDYTANEFKYYENGNLIYTGTMNEPAVPTLSQFVIGAMKDTSDVVNGTWKGDIAVAMAYNRALTESEVSTNYFSHYNRFSTKGNANDEIVAEDYWAYLDDGSDQGTAWQAVAFDDSAWSTSSGSYGFGNVPVAAVATGHTTYYFRYKFNVKDSTKIMGSRLNCQIDDGMVAYVNGNEVYRYNMPGGAITYTTTASTDITGADETDWHQFNINPDHFIDGDNVLAVEVHQNISTSDDLTFDCEIELSEADDQALHPNTAETIHFTQGATGWKYLDNGSDQGSSWSGGGFDDSSWSSGQAPLGYGEAVATTVSYGADAANKYTTTYFRKSFTVDDASLVQGGKFTAALDDGAIFYVNGTEVKRWLMPTSGVTYTTFSQGATARVRELKNYTYYIPASAFVTGTNVLAVELHQHSLTSSDIYFDASLTTFDRFLPGPLSLANSTIAVSSSTVDEGSDATITIQLKDTNGNDMTRSGDTVVVTVTGGTSVGTLGSVTDNGNGNYTATYSGTTGGTAHTVSATVNGQSITSGNGSLQVVVPSPWIAYNDYMSGAGTDANATTFGHDGTTSGTLLDISDGSSTGATVSISSSGVVKETVAGTFTSGTPGHTLFNDYIDFCSGVAGCSLNLTGSAHITYTISGLDPNTLYRFSTSAVRDGGYTDRWTLVTLSGDDTASENHPTGGTAFIRVSGDDSLTDHECALSTGDNAGADGGFYCDWTSIDPGPDGTITITTQQYTGGSGTAGLKGYGMTMFRLEELP